MGSLCVVEAPVRGAGAVLEMQWEGKNLFAGLAETPARRRVWVYPRLWEAFPVARGHAGVLLYLAGLAWILVFTMAGSLASCLRKR